MYGYKKAYTVICDLVKGGQSAIYSSLVEGAPVEIL